MSHRINRPGGSKASQPRQSIGIGARRAYHVLTDVTTDVRLDR